MQQKNVNIVIGIANINPSDWGVIEEKINKRPVTSDFAEWFINRYKSKPLYYYFIGTSNTDFGVQGSRNKAFTLLEREVKNWAIKNNCI